MKNAPTDKEHEDKMKKQFEKILASSPMTKHSGELKPCPHCGRRLLETGNGLFSHPQERCVNEYRSISADQVDQWNTRTGVDWEKVKKDLNEFHSGNFIDTIFNKIQSLVQQQLEVKP